MSSPPLLTPQFVQILNEVRSNDASRKQILVDDCENQVGYGALFGEALRGNTFVSEIELVVHDRISTTIRNNLAAADATRDNYTIVSMGLSPLLDYLRGPIVKKIKLLGGASRFGSPLVGSTVVTKVLLQAIAANPNPLAIEIHAYVPCHTLAQFVREARQSLGRLSVSMYEHDDSHTGAEDSTPVAEAFAANTSLEYLCLFEIPIIVHGYEEDLVGHILRQLHSHPKLHTLVLRAHDVFQNLTIPAALPALLQSNAAEHPVASKLQTIHLESFNITAEDWESTLGVVLRYHAQNPITTVTLENFRLDAGAAQGLVHLIQTEQSTASSSSSTVTDLRIVDPINYLQDPHNLVHLLVPSLPHPLVRVTLLSLELSTLAQLQVLASSLAQAKFLTTLRFVYKDKPVNGVFATTSQLSSMSKLLVQGLEHNESLLVLEGIEEYVDDDEWTTQRDPFFSPRLQRKITAYLDRNRHFAAVLASTLSSPAATMPDATAVPAIAAHMTIGQRQDLAPSLLVSGSKTPRMLATQLVKNLYNAHVASSTLLFGPTVGTVADTQERIL